MAYDAANRLTNRVDGLGTPRYGYTVSGLLAWEDGPWENDTVTYTCTNRLRASLSLIPPGAPAGGRRVLQERHSNPQLSTNTIQTVTYTRGLDLSGTLEGAGGIGGLLAMTVHQGANAGTYFYGYDGNGNVVGLVSAADGTEAARYEYGPFGEMLRVTGPLAFENPFRFSTKFHDDETGWLYYGHRYYDPSTGRWPSRDPFVEFAFVEARNADIPHNDILPDLNDYQFVANQPVSLVDYLGGGIWCKCNFNPPSLPVELASTINNKGPVTIESESDMGTYTCTKSNQGETVKATVLVGCVDRLLTPEWICGCTKKACHVRKIFTCGTGTKGAKRGKAVWIFTSYSISKDCY
ncbi:MAG TPA: RHS repeat-associated core domain-containing protein [Methylomirabilota bacterium]|nr:RHS repeat-associated core domain-containing protein [Methylomirabilota bacterium]